MTTPLTVAQLFTPAPSGVGQNGAVPLLPPAGSWLAIELQVANLVQLPTTAWLPGGPERTLLAINAVIHSESDALVSSFAQSAFLDSAANGTVVYQALNGQTITSYVTPDPSNASQNPTGALGWLDLTTQGVYGVFRLSATYASGPLAIANTTATLLGPYAPGTYHVANAAPSVGQTAATYSNLSTFSVPSGIISGLGGSVLSIAPGLTMTTIVTRAAHGIAVGAVVYVSVPLTAGIIGLAGVFGTVVSVPSAASMQVAVTSSGSYSSGGQIYACTLTTMQADVLGVGSNANPGSVTLAITQNAGVFVSNAVSWSGSNWESNQALVDRTRTSLAAASPNGPSAAFVYFAETSSQILAAETPSIALTNGPVSASESASPVTGLVTVVVASSTPASATLGAAVTPGCAQLPVTGATNANPIVITTSAAHGLLTGYYATTSGILGNTAANGTFIATVLSPTTYSIPIAGNAAYTGGGSVEGGDLGLIDQIIQQNCVPDGTQGAITVSALAFPITVSGTVVVPRANVPQYTALWEAALVAYLASLDIGGDSPVFAVTFDGVVGVLEAAGIVSGAPSYVIAVQNLTVNGGQVDASFPTSQYQAVLAAATSVTVVGA